MLNTYFFPIQTAAFTFPLISFLFALPYVIYSYRKYGSISIWRTLILFSFVFYLQSAFFLVILPLPNPATVAAHTGPFYDLTPFHFITTFMRETSFQLTEPSTWLASVKNRGFLEPFFNFCLLMPFGIYLAYYFQKRPGKVLLFSFLLSLFFELTQLTGLYGIYPRPYRLFAVDDLMLNTLGGLFGYLFFFVFLRFLPNRERMDQKSRERGLSVSYTRRAFALLLDSMVVNFIQLVIGSWLSKMDSLWVWGMALCGYTMGVSLLTRGRTLGKALVRVRVSHHGTPPFAAAILLRLLMRNTMIFGISGAIEMINRSASGQRPWLILLLAMILFSVLDLIFNLRRDRLLWYERLSRTENISTMRDKMTIR